VVAQVVEAATQHFVNEEASVIATRGTGTATCTVTIPYSWVLSTPSSDMLSITYSISAPVEATATTAYPQRLSTQTIENITVPANGTTTSLTITPTF
jgi:hypothetical protein